MKHLRKTSVVAIAAMVATVITGCGTREITMKEFRSADETVSIMLNEKWVEEDVEMEGWVAATNKLGTDAAVVVQMEKASSGLEEIEDLKSMVESTYDLSDFEEAEKPEMSEVTNIEAYKGKMEIDEARGGGYIVYGETDYAYYAFIFAANFMTENKEKNFLKSCESFEENAPEVENNFQAEVTDTIQWINASYAILTHLNGWDYTMYAGMPANESSMELEQEALEEWWGVTDRASADENMDWLLSEGHRTGFTTDMESFAELGISEVAEGDRAKFLLEYYEMTEEEAEAYANLYGYYEIYGENTIAAWDYSRAMSVLSYYYLAGYYTEEEALDKSLEVAQIIQTTFDSWDSYMESYMIGYEYWAEESSAERRAIYEELKAAEDNPYAIDWNLTLEKTW